MTVIAIAGAFFQTEAGSQLIILAWGLISTAHAVPEDQHCCSNAHPCADSELSSSSASAQLQLLCGAGLPPVHSAGCLNALHVN